MKRAGDEGCPQRPHHATHAFPKNPTAQNDQVRRTKRAATASTWDGKPAKSTHHRGARGAVCCGRAVGVRTSVRGLASWQSRWRKPAQPAASEGKRVLVLSMPESCSRRRSLVACHTSAVRTDARVRYAGQGRSRESSMQYTTLHSASKWLPLFQPVRELCCSSWASPPRCAFLERCYACHTRALAV